MKKIPYLPLSAIAFYLAIILFWKMGVIPSPLRIVDFLESLYNQYGLVGLFIASFLEGLVYIGLYFPGSFIIALAVFLSDGTFTSLLSISLVVALALTITAALNYFLGRKIKTSSENKHYTKKSLFLSMLHPNSIAFYFFHSGIKKQSPAKIIFVPLFMIPYGLALGYIFYFFKDGLKAATESPFTMISILLIWFVLATIINFFNSDK